MEYGEILLNGNAYKVQLPIRRYMVQQQAQAIRTSGARLRSSNLKLEPYAFNDWHRGLGFKAVRPGKDEDKQGFFDASVLTLHRQAITLPITETSTPELTGRIDGSCIFNAQLWTLWTPYDAAPATALTLEARRASASTWAGGGTVYTETVAAYQVRGQDLLAADKLYAALTVEGLFDHLIRYSTDGITWSAPATTPITTGMIGTGYGDDADQMRLAYDGARVVCCLHRTAGADARIETWSSTNGGDTWAETTALRFGSSQGITGLAAYLDTDDTTVIYAATSDVLKILDIAAGTQATLLNLNGNANTGRRMVVHNGSLYVPIDNGADAPFGMKKITVRDGQRLIEDVGLDVAQGIPSTLLGAVRWVRSIGPWLFVSMGGNGAGRNAHILATTGLPGDGWQNVNRHATANDLIDWVDGIGQDLYLQQSAAQLTSVTEAGDTYRLINVLAPPNSGVTFDYQATGDLELPEFGGDNPEEAGAFFQVQADADQLVDAAEVLDFEYGLNGAAATTAGPTVNNTNRTGALGTSSRGLSGRTIRQNIEFNRGGSSTLTPQLREWILLYSKQPARLEGFEMTLDLIATALVYKNRDYATMITELETVFDSQTLVPFVESEDTGEKQVRVEDYEYQDWLSGPVEALQHTQREGTVRVKIEELQ